LLGTYAKEPVPPPPGNLESRVWREIRSRRSQPTSTTERFASLLTGWLRWTPTHAAVAVALLIGVVMGHATSRVAPDSPSPRGNPTGDSLGLAVFSAEPPAMPSTLLARQP
jgi:hypothetical protein